MKVVGRHKLDEFADRHGDARSQVESWLREAIVAEWRSPKQLKERYVHASILAENRVIFNIKGNRYRLDVQISYDTQTIFVKRVGTHEEYDSWKF